MKTIGLPHITTLIAAAAIAAASSNALAQDTEKAEKKPDAAAADGAEAMAAYMKLIAPGKEHAQLKKMVGDWTTVQKFWQAPGAPPQEATGTAKMRMIMGGRYLVQTYKSEIPGMGKFQGRGTTAFDNVTKEFIHVWFDSMSTAPMVSRGKAGKDHKVTEMVGEVTEPYTNEKFEIRTVTTEIDANTLKFEMFEKRKDKKESQVMEIMYKRNAGGDSGKGDKKQKAKKKGTE